VVLGRPSRLNLVKYSAGLVSPIRPDELDIAALPRNPLGHLKAEAVADLLQRASWDYREALALNQRLAAQVRELTQRVEELTTQLSSLEEAAARRKQPDELARTLLAAARREQESARREGELLLKKAARRAEQLEADARHRAEGGHSDLARLEALREDMIAQLRKTLGEIAVWHRDAAGELGGAGHEGGREADVEQEQSLPADAVEDWRTDSP
jgi:DNA repair exonuclease SbcCD ATPase subunit